MVKVFLNARGSNAEDHEGEIEDAEEARRAEKRIVDPMFEGDLKRCNQ